MRRLKCLSLVLLSGVLSLFLPSILLVRNTSAATVSNIRRIYLQYVDFSTVNPTQTYTSQTIRGQIYTQWYSVNINQGSIFKLSHITPRLAGSLSYNKDDKWDLTIYIYNKIDSYRGLDGDTLVPTVLCPYSTGNTTSIIDSCDIEYHDMFDSPIDLTHLDVTTPSAGTDYAVQNKIHGYYAMKLKGHFTQNGSGNAIDLRGPLMSAAAPNTSLAQYLTLDFLLAFSEFRIYTEIPDEDKAAEELDEMNQKDDQDRADLETQSSDTDTGAEDSADDFGAATTNISGVISTFISNLNNLNANNCTLPEISAYGFSIGRMNLCTYSPPNWIQGVTTAIISLITLRLAWHLFKRIMGIAKGLAGSK